MAEPEGDLVGTPPQFQIGRIDPLEPLSGLQCRVRGFISMC
jgi:hypothetical protein